jgi:hypothetical protein
VGEGPLLPPRRVGVAGPGLGSANGLRILKIEKFSYFTVYPSVSRKPLYMHGYSLWSQD